MPYASASSLSRTFAFLVILYFPLALLDIRMRPAGIIVRLSDLYLIALIAIFFLSGWEAQRWILRCLWLFVPFVGYVVFGGLFTGNSGGILEAIQWLLTLLWIPIFAYVVGRADVSILKLLWVCVLGVALFTAASHIVQGKIYGYKLMGDAKYSFGFALLIGCLLFGKIKPLIWYPVLLASVVLLVLSDERKSMLFNMIIIFGFVPLLWLMRSRVATAGLFTLLFVLLFASGPILYYGFIQGDPSVTYFVDEQTAVWNSDLHRKNLIANGVDLFLDDPVFGIGAKNLVTVMDDYYIDSSLGLSTHNFYLDILVEYGLVGVALLLVALIAIAINTRRDHPLEFALLPLSLFCLGVPVFMSSGTTTMITFFTGLACLVACSSPEQVPMQADPYRG